MRSGRLRHRVTFENLTAAGSTNSFGGQSEAWSPVATVWAEIQPLQGYEQLRSVVEAATVTHRIRTRYLAGVGPASRIRYKGRIFAISQLSNVDERDREFEILAIEETAA